MNLQQTDIVENVDTKGVWYISKIEDDKVYGVPVIYGLNGGGSHLLKGNFRKLINVHGEYDSLDEVVNAALNKEPNDIIVL